MNIAVIVYAAGALLLGGFPSARAQTEAGLWYLLADGQGIAADSVTIRPDRSQIVMGSGEGASDIPLRQAIALMQRVGRHEPGPRRDKVEWLTLVDGQTLQVSNTAVTEETISGDHALWGRIEFPRQQVARLTRAEAVAPPEGDVFTGVVLRNGDRLPGTIVDASKTAVVVDMPNVGKLPVDDLDTIACLVFDRLKPFRQDRWGGRHDVRCRTRAGDGIRGVLVAGNTHSVDVKVSWREESLNIPLIVLRSMLFTESKILVADLPIAAAKQTPYLRHILPHARNRSLEGRPLRVAGFEAGSGFALHPRTTLQFRMSRITSTPCVLSCLVGIDDEVAGADGHARVRLYLGSTATNTVTVTPGMQPVPVSMEIPAGTRSIALMADYGERGAAGDHVDILWPTLIRRPGAGSAEKPSTSEAP